MTCIIQLKVDYALALVNNPFTDYEEFSNSPCKKNIIAH